MCFGFPYSLCKKWHVIMLSHFFVGTLAADLPVYKWQPSRLAQALSCCNVFLPVATVVQCLQHIGIELEVTALVLSTFLWRQNVRLSCTGLNQEVKNNREPFAVTENASTQFIYIVKYMQYKKSALCRIYYCKNFFFFNALALEAPSWGSVQCNVVYA